MGVPPYPNSTCILRSLGRNSLVARRLAKMGILPGTELRVVRTGPMGDPVELAVEGGQSVALRGKEARALECEHIIIPLLAVKDRQGGQTYRIRQFLGGRHIGHKLGERGLKPGSRIQPLKRRPFTVLCLESGRQIVLGNGEAAKILVEAEGTPDV